MKNKIVIFPLLAFSFAACTNTSPKKIIAKITRDTLNYTYKEVLQKAPDCEQKKDTVGCSLATINYPVFTNQSALNDTMSQRMLHLFDADAEQDFDVQAKNFIAGYDAWVKKYKKKPVNPFKFTEYGKVVRQDSNFVSIEIGGSTLSGNNHPMSLIKFINWDTKAGKTISLADILIPGYNDKLNAAAEKIFRKEENLKDTSSLSRDYFFKGGKFALNNNFLISPIGLRFLYNVYEIKPYAAGTTDVYIPYAQIKNLLKPHTVVSQYIKP